MVILRKLNVAAILLAWLVFGWLMLTPAVPQTVTLKSQLYTDITTNFPDNTTGFITPARVRSVLNNMVASWQQWASVNAQTGTTYTIAATDQGKFVTFNNVNPVAVTIPAAGASFPTGWSLFVKNVGLGVVTITPASGTIGGAASVTLGTGQGLFIDSDGANWQTWGGSGTGSVTSVTCGKNLSGGTFTISGTCDLFDNPALGVSGTTLGQISFYGNTSGVVNMRPQSAAGTPTLSLPTDSGTLVSTAAAPLSINTSSGQISVTTGTLSRVDDTNVTLTLGGTPTNALFNAVSLTLGWTGNLSVARGGTACGVASGACLDNITGFSSTGIMSRDGAASYTFSALSALMDSGLCSSHGSTIYRGAGTWTCLTAGSSGQVFTTGGAGANPSWTSVAGTGTVTSIAQGNGLSFSVTPLTTSGTISADIATASNYYSATANKLLDASVLSQAETVTTYANSPTTFDLNTFVNTRVALTGGISTITFSNLRAGRCGNIRWMQDATGNRQISSGAFPSTFHFPGQTQPVLSTAASAVDFMPFCCTSATHCVANLIKNIGYNTTNPN